MEQKHIVQTLLEYVHLLGVKKIDKLPGLWEHKLDETWNIKCNGHMEDIEGVPAFSFYIEYNGWPAGILSIMGDGVLCAGDGANEETLREAIEAKMNLSETIEITEPTV